MEQKRTEDDYLIHSLIEENKITNLEMQISLAFSSTLAAIFFKSEST